MTIATDSDIRIVAESVGSNYAIVIPYLARVICEDKGAWVEGRVWVPKEEIEGYCGGGLIYLPEVEHD